MRTVKRNPFLSGVCAILGGAFLWGGTAGAQLVNVTSDRPAGLIVIPKLIYDSEGDFTLTRLPTDTEIQLTNTSNETVYVTCFYVNANSHCTNTSFPQQVCFNTDDCQQFGRGGLCVPGWIETDFQFTLTPDQPIVWTIWQGLAVLPLPANTGAIPPVNEDPFFGELKCFQTDENGSPIDRNDLKAEVTIVGADTSGIDARAYNGIGIQAVEGANNGDNQLILGGEEPEYAGCPSVLILDHFFDDAVEPIDGDRVKTHVTIVPCSQSFLFQDQGLFDITVQFLVFNEFEQRFSASLPVNCWKEIELCHIDHKSVMRGIDDVDPASDSCQRSIFSAFVSGTLTGQTRMRGVESEDEPHGHGILAVAEEFYRTSPDRLDTVRATTAFNVHQAGVRPRADIIDYFLFQ